VAVLGTPLETAAWHTAARACQDADPSTLGTAPGRAGGEHTAAAGAAAAFLPFLAALAGLGEDELGAARLRGGL